MEPDEQTTASEAGAAQPAGGGTATNCSDTVSSANDYDDDEPAPAGADSSSRLSSSSWGLFDELAGSNNNAARAAPLIPGVKSGPPQPPGDRTSAENCWHRADLLPGHTHNNGRRPQPAPGAHSPASTETSIELGTLSQSALASNCHLPPSYGTATGWQHRSPVSCLDACQLHSQHQQSATRFCVGAQAICTAIISQHANLPPPGHHNSGQPPASHAKTIDWRTMEPRTPDPPPHRGPQLTSADFFPGPCSTPSATQNARFISPQAAFNQANHTNHSQPKKLLLDNNSSNSSAPINHLIASREPAGLWQAQSNQYYLETGPGAAAAAAPLFAAGAAVQSSVAATLLERPLAAGQHPGSGLVDMGPGAVMQQPQTLCAPGRSFPQAGGRGKPHSAGQQQQPTISRAGHEQQTAGNLSVSLPPALEPAGGGGPLCGGGQPMRRPLLLRSHESLAAAEDRRSSRHQHQAHRKRRRHRSTSGARGEPATDFEVPGEHLRPAWNNRRSADAADAQQHWAARPQAISAHCWLIDSSDEQQQSGGAPNSGPHLGRAQRQPQQQHVTVAMMRQQEASQLRQERLDKSADLFRHCQGPASGATSALGQSYRHLAPLQVQPIYGSLHLNAELHTNSLRLERPLTKHQEAAADYRLRTMPTGKGTRRRPFLLAGRRSSTPSLSSGDEPDSPLATGHAGGQLRNSTSYSGCPPPTKQVAADQASTLVRLSSLLTHVTNLVRRPAKRLKVAQSSQSMSAAHQQPLNSVSGSLRSGGLYSLAVSSSSSSSAYATETSSHLSSNQLARLQQQAHHSHPNHSKLDPPIHLSQMKLAFSSAVPTPSSSLFYSSTSGTSATTQPSTHGYEYCDQQPLPAPPAAETRFAGSRTPTPPPPPLPPSQLAGPARQETATGTLESRSTTNSADESVRGPSHTLASDNELISGQLAPPRSRLYAPSNKTAVSHNAPTLSLKRCFWNTCKTPDNAHLSCSGDAQQNSDGARYKCLPSITTTTVHSSGGSVLQSVISLAKADKTFRLRLIASLLVSCLLVGLICVLFGILYARSSASSSSGKYNNLSLLIDDSDYDVTWLWPATGYNRLQPADANSSQPSLGQKQDSNSQQLRDSLRARLALIEQSERLAQQLDTLNHLNGIQIINNNFIDIARMAMILNPLAAATPGAGPARGQPSGGREMAKSPALQLDAADQDLVSLILLSNLHWPLVKWKQQSQHTVMDFLSSFSSGSPQTAAAGPQTLRNLLAAIMLTESVPHLATNSANLKQFTRLQQLLKSISYDLLSCSYSIGDPRHKIHTHRHRYCLRLLARYRETMQTMRHFDQNKLAKLHEQLNLMAPSGKRAVTSLPGFFLDRLATLSPEIVAASLVASQDTYSDTQEAEAMMNTMLNIDAAEEPRRPFADQQGLDLSDRWQQGKRSSVFELAKLLIDANSFNQFEAELFEEDAKLGDELTLARHLLHPWSSNQLPHLVSPHSYDLFLQPNISSRHFHGMVRIELRLERRTSFIVLNSAGLQLSDISVWLRLPAPHPSNSLQEIQIRRVLDNSFQEQVYIEFFDILEPWLPVEATEHAGPHGQSEEPSFMGELPLRDTSRRQNEFVISLSFNGSSSSSYPVPGLHFLQYGDYFAQPDAELKTIFFTQLEPNNARRLFPCFDEPRFKARFQLNLVHEHHHQVLFNSAKRERVPYTSDGRLYMSVFEQTAIPLSSYLVSVVVCDTHSIKSITTRAGLLASAPADHRLLGPAEEMGPPINQLAETGGHISASAAATARHIQVQILAQFEQLSQAEFASQLAPQLLLFYQTHLQFAYPMDKLDLVAIPRALAGGPGPGLLDTAENMGLIWFKAQLLMLDPNLISQDLIEQVALLLSHQVAHQYFGNIVSVRSWRDAWIFEALCQYLETVSLRYAEHDWRLDEQFTVATVHETLLADSYWLHTPTDWPPQQTKPADEQPPASALDNLALDEPPLPATNGQVEALDSRHSSAILHMFLFTLLPSLSAQTGLLRRCLSRYHYRPMSGRQFWFQFGQQMLQDEATSRRLEALSLSALWSTADSFSGANDSNPAAALAADDQSSAAHFHHQSENSSFDTVKLEANERLELLLEAWLEQAGIPLITASSYRDKIRLSQERFQAAWWNTALDALNSSTTDDHQPPPEEPARPSVWPIPLLFTTSLEPRTPRFLWMDEQRLELPLAEQGSASEFVEMRRLGPAPGGWWFKLNTNQSSLVRVNYDERNWELLTDLLAKSHYSNHLIGPLDRANLIDDALTLMRCGRLSVGLAMNLTLYLEVGERDYMPWMSALRHLEQMQILLNQNPLWHRYVLKMIRPISSVIGWKDDGPHLMRKLRRQLFSVALQYGDEKIVAKAKQEFKGWYKSNRFIVPNLQELAYVAGVRYGDQQEWFFCWQKYQRLVSLELQLMNATDAAASGEQPVSGQHDSGRGARQVSGKPGSVVVGLSEPSEPNSDYEKKQLLTALANTQNTWILEQFLNSTLDSRKIQTQHMKLVVQTLGKNPVARLYLWRFVRLNWHNLFVRFMREADYEEPSDKQEPKLNEAHLILETLIIESTKHFSTKLDYEEVSSFFASKRKLIQEHFSRPFRWTTTLDNAVKRSLQFIRANIYWCEIVEPRLTKWLAHNDGVIMN